jgi:hypothetical protein
MREKRENKEKVIDAKPVGHYPHTLPHQEDNAKTISNVIVEGNYRSLDIHIHITRRARGFSTCCTRHQVFLILFNI